MCVCCTYMLVCEKLDMLRICFLFNASLYLSTWPRELQGAFSQM